MQNHHGLRHKQDHHLPSQSYHDIGNHSLCTHNNTLPLPWPVGASCTRVRLESSREKVRQGSAPLSVWLHLDTNPQNRHSNGSCDASDYNNSDSEASINQDHHNHQSRVTHKQGRNNGTPLSCFPPCTQLTISRPPSQQQAPSQSHPRQLAPSKWKSKKHNAEPKAAGREITNPSSRGTSASTEKRASTPARLSRAVKRPGTSSINGWKILPGSRRIVGGSTGLWNLRRRKASTKTSLMIFMTRIARL